jgi:hypothetical protein
MIKTIRFYVFLLITALLIACAAIDRGYASTGSLSATLQFLAAKHGVCNVAVAVIKDRKLYSVETAMGCAPTVTLKPTSVFQAASLSKPVFAYARSRYTFGEVFTQRVFTSISALPF